jgi:hypothetical protein
MIGEIIACCTNAPGSWHDSHVAQPIYEKLQMKTPPGYYLVMDTAFPQGTSQIADHICAPMKSGTCLPADEKEQEARLVFDRQLLAFHQAAEWEGSFGQLCVPLPINYNELHGDLLETCLRLFNLHT